MSRRRILTDHLPRPMDCERKSSFIVRFTADPDTKRAYDTPSRRLLGAEQAWARAKAASIVSISTSEDQFLLFGRIDQQ